MRNIKNNIKKMNNTTKITLGLMLIVSIVMIVNIWSKTINKSISLVSILIFIICIAINIISAQPKYRK